ncbi:hypothetical protein DRH29_01120 [candidate division Kazan bacterium]|uniref:Uncharacterized protein n=1 Tax=candidate division Kazan bacterium TaxID=2202143 RepID=A0A420ZDG1_UNCK3|nr:MAG: hypothetical protein DRH29_01120 [candidate division Kazan bacterium]
MEFEYNYDNPELNPLDSNENERANPLGESLKTVDQISAEVFKKINELPDKDQKKVSHIFDRNEISDDSIALFAGWLDNMKQRVFPVKSLREQFNLVAERFAADRNNSGETKENPNMEKHMKRLTSQYAGGIRFAAKALGADAELLNEVTKPEGSE